jgi:ATP-dependent Clp protease protease subunit
MATRTETKKQALEVDKLAIEIRKESALAEKAELEAADLRRESRDHEASANQARIYPFTGAVNSGSVQACVATLAVWSRRNPGDPMTIVFNSPGGSVIDGLALYDAIDDHKRNGHHVTTIARGMVASMGGILLQAGTKRIIGHNASMLIHEISSGWSGKMSELKDETKFLKHLDDRCAEILAERSTLTAKQIKGRAERRDWWLTSSDVLTLGLADEIA